MLAQGQTLLHESYHSWGYDANSKGRDWADEWAGIYMPCLMRMPAWKKFMADPRMPKIRKLAKNEVN